MLVAGTLFGRRNRPHLLEAWGQRFDVQLEKHITMFRYGDVPGDDRPRRHALRPARHQHRLRGRRRHVDSDDVGADGLAVMVITTDAPVPHEVIDEIVALDGFEAGRTMTL